MDNVLDDALPSSGFCSSGGIVFVGFVGDEMFSDDMLLVSSFMSVPKRSLMVLLNS